MFTDTRSPGSRTEWWAFYGLWLSIAAMLCVVEAPSWRGEDLRGEAASKWTEKTGGHRRSTWCASDAKVLTATIDSRQAGAYDRARSFARRQRPM